MLAMLEAKTSKLTAGQRNYIKLKKEVIDMRTDLEHHYNITQITSMEDDLTRKTIQLRDLRSETKTQKGIVDDKKKILDEINQVTEN
jgi:hypothetical protein